MTFPGSRAVVLGNVDVSDLIPTALHRRCQIFFLDIRVDSVVHHLEVGMIDFPAESGVGLLYITT